MGYWYLDNAYTSYSHAASFGYDNVYRMTSAVASAVASGSVSFNFAYGYTNDSSNGQYGNGSCLQNSQTNGPCTTVTLNPATNQIATIGGSGTGISYDAAGNLLADGNGTFSTSATYDAEGRQTSTLQYGYGNTYTYNALGQRVERSCSWNPYPYDDYFDAFGNLTLNVYQGTSLMDYMPPVAGRRYAEYASGVRFTHANALGSLGLVTDHAGNAFGETLYYPWGQTWAQTGTGVSIFADMQYQDWATGFYFTPYRVYDWQYYRWMSPDPLGGDITNPQSLNRYAYVMNNPATLTDPSGLQSPDQSQCVGSYMDCLSHSWTIQDYNWHQYWNSQNLEALFVLPNIPVYSPYFWNGEWGRDEIGDGPGYINLSDWNGGDGLQFPDNPFNLRIVQVSNVCTSQGPVIDYALQTVSGDEPVGSYYVSEHVFGPGDPRGQPNLAAGGSIFDMSTETHQTNRFIDTLSGLWGAPPVTIQFFSISLSPDPNSPGITVPISGAPGGVNHIQQSSPRGPLVNGKPCSPQGG